MNFFGQTGEPVFLRESNSAQKQLKQLIELEPKLNDEGKKLIRLDIKRLEYGIEGEKTIAFELKNSHMPMVVLHDIYLEDGDLSAQIDFIVFTRKLTFLIECKNLYGDIEITNTGDFIRKVNYFGKTVKEGFYSPITQIQRHFELLKKIKMDNAKGLQKVILIAGQSAGQWFEDFYKPVIVMANSKTILNVKYAKKDIKDKVIRADRLVQYIKDMNDQSKEFTDTQKMMIERAQRMLSLHKNVKKDYTQKYMQYLDPSAANAPVIAAVAAPAEQKKEDTPVPEFAEKLISELKSYRLDKSREENCPPYVIYTDAQLQELVSRMPRTISELLDVFGFGHTKAAKYGYEIIEIINRHYIVL